MKKLLKNEKGFTIIEVMIVLVIAAVILLIVFLAVPALQRNSRNTQRKNDVARVLAAIGEYMSNKNGAYPTVICNSGDSTTVTVGGGSCATPTDAVTASVSGQFSVAPTIAGFSGSPTATADQLKVYTGAGCTGGTTIGSGTGRSVAILYIIENNVTQCTAS